MGRAPFHLEGEGVGLMRKIDIGLAFAISTMALMALPGCGASDEGEGVGGVSASEAQALNEAAAILDERAANAQAALQGNSSD